MSSQQIHFFYKRPFLILPLTILVTSVTSCFLSIFVSLIYTGRIEPFLKLGIQPVIIFLIAMLGLFGLLTNKSVKNWFWLLVIEDDVISLKTLNGKIHTLNQKDIQKLEWQKKKVILSTVSDSMTFDINSMPINKQIEFSNILPYWLPPKSLPPELHTAVNEIEKFAEEPPILQNPVQASASLKHTITDMNHFIVVLMIIFVIAATTYGVLTIFGVGLISLSTICVCLVFVGIVLWSIINKRIELTNEGIGYQVGFRRYFFRWNDIEVITAQPSQGQILIWVNGRYSRIPLVGLHPGQFASFEQEFSRQVYTRKIPFGYT